MRNGKPAIHGRSYYHKLCRDDSGTTVPSSATSAALESHGSKCVGLFPPQPTQAQFFVSARLASTMRRPIAISIGHWLLAKAVSNEEHFYQADPVGYERIVEGFERRRAVAAAYCEIVRDYFSTEAPELILDLACGTGILSEALSRVGKSVVGFDLSEGMMRHGRNKGLTNTEFRHGDFHDLSGVDDNSVDVVTQFAASRYIEDAHRHHNEIARVLKPKGIAILSYFDARDRSYDLAAAARHAGLRTDKEVEIPRSPLKIFYRVLGYRDTRIRVFTVPLTCPAQPKHGLT